MKGALGVPSRPGARNSNLNPRIREISRATPGDPTSTVGVRRCVISRRAMAVMSHHSKGDGGMQGVPSPTTVEVNAASATGTPVSTKSKATASRDPARDVRLERNEVIKIKRRARKEGEVDEVCECTPDRVQGGCYDDDKCEFRAMRRQCSLRCPNAQIGMCGNRVFRDASKHPKTKVDDAGTKGLGLFADAVIKKDSFIIEYIGEVITEEELEQRKAEYKKEGLGHSYFKQLRAGVYIDPTKKGNRARYMNHSDTPNCMGELWDVDGEECIGIFAKADIKAGEELTWDYGDDFFSDGHTVNENESIAVTETPGETVTVEPGEPDDAMTTPMSKVSVGAAEPPAAVETGAVANEMDTDTPMVSKASSRRLSFMTPMDSRIQDSCTTGPRHHPLMNSRLKELPPKQGVQEQTIENDESEDSEPPSADKPQAGVVCAVWNCTTENRNKTPTWRPGPDGSSQLCNACGDKYSKDKDRVQKHPKREGWYEMREVKSKRSPQPRGEAPAPKKRAKKTPTTTPQTTTTPRKKKKTPWSERSDFKGDHTLTRLKGDDAVFDDIRRRFIDEGKDVRETDTKLTVTAEEASRQLEKWVQQSLDTGVTLKSEEGPYAKGCALHSRLGVMVHGKKTASYGCGCNQCEDEWSYNIKSRLITDKDSWYMVGNYENLLQKSRGKRPNTVDDEENEPGDEYMSEGDFGGTEDDSQTSEEDATDDSESSEEEEGDTQVAPFGMTAECEHPFHFILERWLPWAERNPQPKEIIRFFREINAHFQATGLYNAALSVAVSMADSIDKVKETVNQMYNAIDEIDPGGLTGYLTSGDIPSDEKRSSTSTSPTQRVPGSRPPPSETLQELTKGSFEKVINEVAPLIKEGASFIDIGCGRGNCCLHWKIFDPKSKVAGVDVNENRIQIAKEVAGKIGQDVSFSEGDAADEEGAIEYDVVYSFDKVFTGHDREAIYRRLNASPQWKVFVTFRKLREEVEGARLVSTPVLSVRQSTQKHTAYVYEKDRLLALYNKAVRSSQSVVE